MNNVPITIKLSVGGSEYSSESSIDAGLLSNGDILRSVLEKLVGDFEENLGRLMKQAGGYDGGDED